MGICEEVHGGWVLWTFEHCLEKDGGWKESVPAVTGRDSRDAEGWRGGGFPVP